MQLSDDKQNAFNHVFLQKDPSGKGDIHRRVYGIVCIAVCICIGGGIFFFTARKALETEAPDLGVRIESVSETPAFDQKKVYSIRFVDGAVYFGHVVDMTSEQYVLSDVFYTVPENSSQPPSIPLGSIYSDTEIPGVGVLNTGEDDRCRITGWVTKGGGMIGEIREVDIFRDGSAREDGIYIGRFQAQKEVVEQPGSWGFEVAFSKNQGLKDGKTHSIYAYAVFSDGSYPLLSGVPKSITCQKEPNRVTLIKHGTEEYAPEDTVLIDRTLVRDIAPLQEDSVILKAIYSYTE